MSTPKRKAFRDRLHVYSTKSGSQYVRPSEVIGSKHAKSDMARIRESFKQAGDTHSEVDKRTSKK